jgi:hypothetical protein
VTTHSPFSPAPDGQPHTSPLPYGTTTAASYQMHMQIHCACKLDHIPARNRTVVIFWDAHFTATYTVTTSAITAVPTPFPHLYLHGGPLLGLGALPVFGVLPGVVGNGYNAWLWSIGYETRGGMMHYGDFPLFYCAWFYDSDVLCCPFALTSNSAALLSSFGVFATPSPRHLSLTICLIYTHESHLCFLGFIIQMPRCRRFYHHVSRAPD